MIYQTSSYEVLDNICFKHYGSEKYVKEVLKANRFLADLGAVMPPRTKITLPVLSKDNEKKRIALWD